MFSVRWKRYASVLNYNENQFLTSVQWVDLTFVSEHSLFIDLGYDPPKWPPVSYTYGSY